MKTFCLLAFTVLIVTALAKPAENDDQKKEQLKKFKQTAEECKERESASDDDLKQLLSREAPVSYEGKCLYACVQEEIGLVKDRKLNAEGAARLANIFYGGNQEAIEAGKEVLRVCETIQHDDRCELAEKLRECTHAEAKKHGIFLEINAY